MKGRKGIWIMGNFCLFANGFGYWLIAFVVTLVPFLGPIIKLFGREGTWARARTTGIWFLVVFVIIGITPAWLSWFWTAASWLYDTNILMFGLFGGSLLGLILTKIYDREDWRSPSAYVFVPSLFWVCGFMIFHTV